MPVEIDRYTIGKIALVVGVGAGAFLVYKKLRQRRTEKWVEVGKISDILIYPIKSCKGRSVPEAECLSLGLKHGDYYDRRFVIADENGKVLTAREEPKLLLIECRLENDNMALVTPGKETVQANLKEIVAKQNVTRIKMWENLPIDAHDCGSEIADWINDHLGKTGSDARYRLYFHTPELFNSRNLDKYEKLTAFGVKRKDLAIFPDLTPFMLMTEGSMADVNSRTPNGEQFPIYNFRPNFVVSDTTKAYDEDNWAKVKIGEDTLFTNVKPCTRCTFTTINWETGEKHPRQEPLRTLRSYRVSKTAKERKYYKGSPMLGINLAIDKLGTVRVGDTVYVTYKN